MKKIITQLLICFFGINSVAQITETCATGTIKLKTQNHQYGTLEWEKSQDAVNWIKIHNEHDTTYVFTPTVASYYRAVNKFPSCEPIISSVTLVQRPPVANAGQDRLVNDDELYLGANTAIGSTGTWSVFEGNGGFLSDPTDPRTKFIGTTGDYKLIWTLQNSCGVSTDTINVKFVNNQYHEKIVIVDNTDVMLSTQAQLANGDYIIKFSTPVPVIDTETILVGQVGNGYLRKVNAVTQNGNTFTMTTTQGKLKDLFINGGFELGNVFKIDTILPASRMANYNRLTKIPTRAEILSNPHLRVGKHFFVVNESISSPYNGISMQRVATTDSNPDNPEFNFTFNNTIVNQGSFNCHLNGGLTFTPNVYADYETTLLHTTFNVGLNNATVVSDYQFSITNTTNTNLFDHDFSLYTYNRLVYFLIGAQPVLVNVGVDFNGKASSEVNTDLSFIHSFENTVTTNAGLSYKDGVWTNHYDDTITTTLDNNLNITGSLTQNFEIGPKMTFMIYDVIGPYVDVKLTEDLMICTSSIDADNLNWKANLNLGAKFTLGVKAEVLDYNLFDYAKTWENRELYTVDFPYTIEYHSGNNQHYIQANQMTNPVKVRVMSNKGFPVPGTVVKFEPFSGNGTVSDTFVVTDLNGYAQTFWSPIGTGVSKLSTIVQDCNQNNISNSPLVFEATEITGIDCTHTTLYADYIISGNLISPTAHMGVPPYTYSTDNINFSSLIPQITMSAGGNYSASIKDSNGCMAFMNYYNGPANCNNSGLNIQLQSFGGNLYATGHGGRPPYLYSLDNITSYAANNVFSDLTSGYHTVFVKDANGCTKRSVTSITNATTGLIAYFNTNPNAPFVGEYIQFNNLSSNATTYLWDFGDGTTSTATNPTKIYNNNGSYTVTLTASNGTSQNVFQNIVNLVYDPALVGCWKQLASGGFHTIGIKNNGTLYGWGNNDSGQMGNGNSSAGGILPPNVPTQIWTDNDWKQVAAGQYNTYAIKYDGSLWAWGNNQYGQLGKGNYSSTIQNFYPRKVGTTNDWKYVAAGYFHVIAIKNDGTLWAWGRNTDGQLGDGTITNKNIPTQIGTDNDWVVAEGGGLHTLAIKTNGTLWAWGANNVGQLGDNSFNPTFPFQVGFDSDWQQITCGDYHSGAIKENGTLWMWGYNNTGQLGTGTTNNEDFPIQIGTDTTWKNSSAKYRHTSAIKEDGSIWSFGDNINGAFTDSSVNTSLTPILINNNAENKNIVSGFNNSVLLKNDGSISTWGINQFGQLGNGTTSNSFIPSQISCPD